MNILVISRIDCANCGYFTAQAINRYTEHHARSVRRKPNTGYIQYPVDVEAPGSHELRSLWTWADVVHVYDTPSALPLDLPARPTVITYNGSMYRKRRAYFDRRDRTQGRVQTATTLDLATGQVGWLPCARPPLDAYRCERRAGFVVVHAPTSRKVKSTEAVIKALGRLRGVRLDVIEGTTWTECLERKASAHIVVDQFELGYGCNAVEAWALGVPVVGNGRPDILEAMRRVIGYVPFTVAPLERLAKVVLELRRNASFYAYELERGRHCYQAHHSLESVAHRALGYYQEALERFASQPQAAKGLPGRDGMELLQYRGLNVGIETYHGALTGARYKFAGGDTRWVDRRDAVQLLGLRDPRDRPLFERIEVRAGSE